jgi:hypothetical protein
VLDRHPFFTRWTDPETGAASYLLNERVAPLQKGLYYVTPSISADNRWLWFNAVFPPSRAVFMAVVSLDPERPAIRWFPETHLNGNPLVLPEGNAAYVPIHDGIYRLTADGGLKEMVRLPADLIGYRRLGRVVTGLTVSADGRHLILDSDVGNRTELSLVETATWNLTRLCSLPGVHHHVYFSPTDPELFCIAQAPNYDPVSGDKNDMIVRMWVMNTAQTRFEPVFGDLWFKHNCMSCHEWWAADGTFCWCDYNEGVYETDVARADRKKTLVWPRPMCHAQCDRTKRYYVGDQNPYDRTDKSPCRVFFFDRATGRDIAVVSRMGQPDFGAARGDWRSYHLDPHAHFSPDGSAFVYTTTVRGTVDVAVTPVADMLQLLVSLR